MIFTMSSFIREFNFWRHLFLEFIALYSLKRAPITICSHLLEFERLLLKGNKGVMYVTNFVHKTVNGLKSLLDEKGAIKLFCSEGDIMEFLVTFSQDKATLNDIQS